MDGSMGNELLARRSDLISGLWSAQYLIDAPELVKEVHLEYINSGADLIITNTYSTIPSYLSKKNAVDKMPALIRLAGELAREAASNGDKILSENYLQHADHFSRVINLQEISKTTNQNSDLEINKYVPIKIDPSIKAGLKLK